MAVTIEKPGSTGAIVVQGTEFQQKPYIDVRNFFLDKSDEELKPTKKGLMVPLEAAVEVAQAILAEADALQKAKTRPPRYYVFMPTQITGKMPLCKVDESEVFDSLEEIRGKTVADFDAKVGCIYRFTGEPELKGKQYIFKNPKITLLGKWSKTKQKWLKVKPPAA